MVTVETPVGMLLEEDKVRFWGSAVDGADGDSCNSPWKNCLVIASIVKGKE